jgi:hypothetical protein
MVSRYPAGRQARYSRVIRFHHVCVREAEREETEGRKPRPVAVGGPLLCRVLSLNGDSLGSQAVR